MLFAMWRFVAGIEWTPIVRRVEYTIDPEYRYSRLRCGISPL